MKLTGPSYGTAVLYAQRKMIMRKIYYSFVYYISNYNPTTNDKRLFKTSNKTLI